MQSQGHCNIDAFQCGDTLGGLIRTTSMPAKLLVWACLNQCSTCSNSLPWLPLSPKHIVGLLGDNLSGNVLLTSHCIIGMMQPAISNASSKAGMAVIFRLIINLHLTQDQPMFRPKHPYHMQRSWCSRSWDCLRVLPSIAITCAPKTWVIESIQLRKHCWNCFGSRRAKQIKVSWDGMPFGITRTSLTTFAWLCRRSQSLSIRPHLQSLQRSQSRSHWAVDALWSLNPRVFHNFKVENSGIQGEETLLVSH